ncbi:MAG: primosomal protein N' [candidate division WOR-3 bacterium]
MKYFNVAVPIDKFCLFTYKSKKDDELKRGSVVKIPFRNKILEGVIIEEGKYFKGAKEITEKMFDLPEDLFELCLWVSGYYICPIGLVFSFCLPPIMKKVKTFKEYTKKDSTIKLNASQIKAYRKILKAIEEERFETFLLFGVTGSGKTEIYLKAIESVLDKGKSALYLTPEISMIPQIMERIRDRFGTGETYNYKSSRGMRYSYWINALNGNLKIGVGSRMSVFSPLRNLGLIIVDEEHSDSYRQDELKPRFSGRDVAVMRGKIGNFPIILGSATPSVESFYNAKTGKYNLLELPKRVEGMDLPDVTVINPEGKIFSELMEKEIENALNKEKPSRVILFLNRRGYAPFGKCYNCDWTARCRNCDISLTLHKKSNALICHHCGFRTKKIEICPVCGKNVFYLGWGTQKVEEEILNKYAEHSITRMDTDSITGRHTHEEIYSKLKKGEIKILLGTQMVTKGLDLPDIGFVGVLSADTNLNFPDFRASEKTFQLLSQVAGRAGRGEPGKVLIQSSNPNHYAIKNASEHDFRLFYKEEIEFRKSADYPPFTRLARIIVKSKESQKAEKASLKLKDTIERMPEVKRIIILGPVACPIGKIEKYFRYHLLLKSKAPSVLQNILRRLYTEKIPGIKMSLEIDPVNML